MDGPKIYLSSSLTIMILVVYVSVLIGKFSLLSGTVRLELNLESQIAIPNLPTPDPLFEYFDP